MANIVKILQIKVFYKIFLINYVDFSKFEPIWF